ncbi:hypothetical protein PSPO01_00560 [Paraphaeosphaeria sporulosa]
MTFKISRVARVLYVSTSHAVQGGMPSRIAPEIQQFVTFHHSQRNDPLPLHNPRLPHSSPRNHALFSERMFGLKRFQYKPLSRCPVNPNKTYRSHAACARFKFSRKHDVKIKHRAPEIPRRAQHLRASRR